MKRPNIVFFFTDDQRFDTVGALGNTAIHTPNLDALVARGCSFTHAHIPGGTVPAVCMPSRAMVHTGRTLFHIADAGMVIDEAHVMLGEHLGGQGYNTWGTGKWHNGPAAFNRGFSDGAEIFFGGMNDHWNVPACNYDPSGHYATRLPIIPDFYAASRVVERQADHITPGKHSSDLFCDAAADYIKTRDSSDPFFVYVAFMAPHDPRSMPREFLDLYDPDKIELPPNFMPQHPFDNGDLEVRDELLAPFPRTASEIKRHLAEYYAMVSHLDAGVGKVLAALERRGLTNDTIIVFAGDNGLALGQHGLMGKQSSYEHSTRVPLILAGPGIPQGGKSDAYAYLLDIYPTLCDLAGLPTPDSVEGRSLVAAMSDPDDKVRDTLFLAYSDSHRGVKDRRFKLIEYAVRGERTTQLFDLEKDPWETENLGEDPAYAGELQRLRAELICLRDEWDDRNSPWGQGFWDTYENPGAGAGSRFSSRTRVVDLIADQGAYKIIFEIAPELITMDSIRVLQNFPLYYASERRPEIVTPRKLAAIEDRLAEL